MKKILLTALFASLVFILNSCVGAMPEYKNSKSSYIVFKTRQFAYADMGFVAKADDEVKVEIYSSGQALVRLRITPTQVCMTKIKCMSAERFNKEYLGANYPKDTLFRVFRGEAIFNAEGKKDTSDGFIQKIDSIEYEVSSSYIRFIDRAHGVKIEIK
jgi:hypothetical protein